jgi:hypothetical protein
LNKGVVVLPQAAYVNMMRTEIDQLREKLEVIMRERMDEYLESIQRLVNDHTHSFPTEHLSNTIISRELDSLLAKFNADFERLIGGNIIYS